MIQGGTRKKEGAERPMGRNPLVTIITVVFNGVNELEETILSIKDHCGNNLEYIIIDGGSDDGTVEIVRKYDSVLAYWISEPDRGIYDALNKGISVSKGYFFYVLNVGDKLIEFPRKELIDAKALNVDVVLFDVLLSNNIVFRSKLDSRIRFGNTIHHQGAFYKRDLNIQYDLRYNVFSDFNTNQLLFLQKKQFLKFEKVVGYHSLDGVSHNEKYLGEYLEITRRNFGVPYMLIGYLYVKFGRLKNRLRKLLQDNLNG